MSLESFTYGSEKIGGASPSHNTDILDHFMLIVSQDQAEFVCRFAVRVTPSGNAQTDFTALATACQAVELALRTRYQKLTMDWGASNQETFDPSVNAGTAPSSGFTQEPNLRKLDDFPNSGEARGYEFRVSMGQYPTYTDAYGAANGRRQVDVSLHYDIDQRLVVTMTGVWTQVPSSLARAKFLAIFDGVSGYAAYRLSLINTASAAGATWANTRRDESDPNDLSTLTFTREYQQHVNGRRGSSKEIFYGPQGLRTVTIRGTYLRTISGTGGAYGNVYGSANTSLANFLDGANGGVAFAVTTLAALTAGEGGALTVGQNCELVGEPYVTTNEQQDRTEYSLVYQELMQQQSNASGGFLDDPNIVGDSMIFKVHFNELSDSPSPPALPTDPDKTDGATGGSGGASFVALKPVDLFVSYDASFKTSVTDCYSYFRDNVLPLLIRTITDEFNLQGAEFVSFDESTQRTKNHVGGELHLRAYNSNVILFTYTFGISHDLGIRADPAFSGTAHDYLVQQGLPKTTATRTIEAVYFAGSMTLDSFVTPPAKTGWVPLANAQPNTKTKVLGITAFGVPTTALTYAILEETLLWVHANVEQTGGGQDGRTATVPGLGINPPPTPVAPSVATWLGG